MGTTIRKERPHVINGVAGIMSEIISGADEGTFARQRWRATREFTRNGKMHRIRVNVRFDDDPRNGHNTLSITGEIDVRRGTRWVEICGGCIHDEIKRKFPELAHLIKWHLCSTDGPMHYVANTVYHAGDRDCWGLRAGEVRQIRRGGTGELCWRLEADATLPEYVDAPTCPSETATLRYVPRVHVGEGKARELDAARSTAVWPDATDAELMVEPAELTAALEARLPRLMAEFRADVECAGFLWECPK